MKRKIIAVITIVVLISVLQTSFIADAKVYSDTAKPLGKDLY